MSMLYSRLNIFSFKNIENSFFSLQANVVEQVCIIQNNIYLKSIRKNIKVDICLFLTHAHSTMNKNKKKQYCHQTLSQIHICTSIIMSWTIS